MSSHPPTVRLKADPTYVNERTGYVGEKYVGSGAAAGPWRLVPREKFVGSGFKPDLTQG